MGIETFDRLPDGWFVLDVMCREVRSREWTALVIDMIPRTRTGRRGYRKARQAWFHIPGQHRDRDAAWDALEAACATRH